MIRFEKLKDGNVAIYKNDDLIVLTPVANLIPDVYHPDYVLITPQFDGYNNKDKIVIDYKESILYGQRVNSRNELIHILKNEFFTTFRIDMSRFLDTIGNGNGDTNFNKDFSNNYGFARFVNDTKKHIFINRLIVFIGDSGSVDAGYYGNNTRLNNGIKILLYNSRGIITNDITGNIPIKTNADYAKFGFQVSDLSFGSGLNYVHAVLTFSKNGTPLYLEPEARLQINFQDDFSKLNYHHFRVGAYAI